MSNNKQSMKLYTEEELCSILRLFIEDTRGDKPWVDADDEWLQQFLKQKTTSNNKQSSVEWLQAIELERDLTLADWNKAKEMHKEEHAATARDWWVEGASDAHKTPTGRYESFHDYYAKKFKQ